MAKVKVAFYGAIAGFLIVGGIMIWWHTTANWRAKNWSGTAYVNLTSNQEFINITWKDESIWYLIRDRDTGNYEFIEKTPLGILPGGKIVIRVAK